METVISVLFGIFFGVILTLGFTMTRKHKTPTTGTGGGGGSINVDNQDVKDNNDKFEQAQ